MSKIYIPIIILLLCLSIGCGIYGYSAGKRVSELDRESGILREQLAGSSERIKYLESEYSRITRENAELRREITDGLAVIYDGASNLEERLQNITESGRGLSAEMRKYLP